MASAIRTQGVKGLVEEVLGALGQPYSEDVIDEVFLAIEKNAEWHRRYLELCQELGEDVVNKFAGRWIAQATGRAGDHQVGSRSSLIRSYSKLYPPEPRNKSLASLYLDDETAWLETMSRLIAERRYGELDYGNLNEFLADMARRDKREALSRLEGLMEHLLKWEHQPDRRSRSWQRTIVEHRLQLNRLLESGTLRNYVQETLPEAYRGAVKLGSSETGLGKDTFPESCPWSLGEILGEEPGVGPD
jgi:hypothetical protein